MWIFQVFARTKNRELVQGLLLAESKSEAVALAVDRTNHQFGAGSKVVLIVPVIDAGELRTIQNAGLHSLLAELDQLRFIAWHLHSQTRRMAELVTELVATVREAQQRGSNDA